MTALLPRHATALPGYCLKRDEIMDVMFGMLDSPFSSLSSPEWDESLVLLERSIPEVFTARDCEGWVRQITQMRDVSRTKHVMKYHVACALLTILENV